MADDSSSNFRSDLRGTSQDLRAADGASRSFFHTLEHLAAGFLGVKTATSLLSASMAHQLESQKTVKSDMDELYHRTSAYTGELRRINEELAILDAEARAGRPDVRSSALEHQKVELLQAIRVANNEFDRVKSVSERVSGIDLPALMAKVVTAKGFITSTVAGAVGLKYIQLSGDFNQTLVASNQTLGERNRLLNKGVDIQLKTGMSLHETAEIFEGLRQRGVLYLGSESAALREFSQSAAGLNQDFDKIVESANKLAVATGATTHEAVSLLGTSQLLKVSYTELTELANKLTKQTTMTGSNAVKLVEQLGDLRAQYGLDGTGLNQVATDVAALQDAMTGVGVRDPQMAIKFAGAISDVTTSTGQFAQMFGTGGKAVLRDSERFLKASANIAKYGSQIKGDDRTFKAFADNIGLGRAELMQLVRVFDEGRLGPARAKLKETSNLTEDYADQLAETGRVWKRLLESALGLTVKGLWPLTKSIDFIQKQVAKLQGALDDLPDPLKAILGVATAIATAATTFLALKGLGSVLKSVVMSLLSMRGAGATAKAAIEGIATSAGSSAVAGLEAAAANEAAATALSKLKPKLTGEALDAGPLKKGLMRTLKEAVSGWSWRAKPSVDGAGATKSVLSSPLAFAGELLKALGRGIAGTFSGFGAFLSRTLPTLFGPLGLILVGLTTAVALLTSWLDGKSKNNLKEIKTTHENDPRASSIIEKALASYRDQVYSGASPAELEKIAKIQQRAALDLSRTSAEIDAANREQNDPNRGAIERLVSWFEHLKGLPDTTNQFDTTQFKLKHGQRLLGEQSELTREGAGLVGGQLVAEGPRASVARVDDLRGQQDALNNMADAMSTSSVGSTEYLRRMLKILEKRDQDEQRREADERAAAILKNQWNKPDGLHGRLP